MIIKQKTVINQYGESVNVVLKKNRYSYSIEVNGLHFATEYNQLFAVQKYNEI